MSNINNIVVRLNRKSICQLVKPGKLFVQCSRCHVLPNGHGAILLHPQLATTEFLNVPVVQWVNFNFLTNATQYHKIGLILVENYKKTGWILTFHFCLGSEHNETYWNSCKRETCCNMKKDNGTVHYNVSSKILALQCFLKKFWAMDEFKAVSFIWANRFILCIL